MKTMGMAPSEDSLAVRFVKSKNISCWTNFQKMIKIADTDGSGVVEFQEFMEMICDTVEVNISIFS